MKHCIPLLTALLLVPLAAMHAAEPTLLKHTGQVIELVGDRDALGLPDKPGMRRSTRMPDLLVLNDQYWIVVYNEYPTPSSGDAWSRIVQQTTEDGGKTWHTRVVSHHLRGAGNWNMVRIGKLRDGRLVLSSATRGGGNRGFLWFSQDNGKT